MKRVLKYFQMKYYSILLALLVISCGKEDEISEEGYQSFSVPQGFPEATYNFTGTNVKDEEAVFELGRELFYEGKLSSDNTISCAECHNQAFVFTHHGHNLSTGVNEALGTRNTQALQNLAFQESFTWDGVATQLFQQPIIPITAEVEMNESFSNVITKLTEDENYKNSFQQAFSDGEVNTVNILTSLANFMGMMVSSNSKYDKYVRGESGGDFTEDEVSGLELFNQKCATCHSGVLFTDESFRNNGLELNVSIPNELGRQVVTDDVNDFYKFKVPSLRNVEKSGPYMHDGRISTLRGVLDYYDTGVVETFNLDSELNKDGVLGIPLEETEKDQLMAFLETLTDEEFLNDERFSRPD